MRTASIRNSNFKVTCAKCGDALIAPEWVEYFSEGRLSSICGPAQAAAFSSKPKQMSLPMPSRRLMVR